MKLALAQINPTIGDFERNVRQILDRVAWAEVQGADLLCLSEMVLTGYPPRDLLENPEFVERAGRALADVLRAVKGPTAVCLGTMLPNTSGSGLPLHNSAVIIEKGKIVFTQHKTLLPNYDVFDEQRHFEPAQANAVWQRGDERIGVSICEDLWFYEKGRYHHDPIAALAKHKPTLVLNLSASPFELGKDKVRLKLLQSAAKICGAPVAFMNQVGGNDELIFDGGSMVVGADGAVIDALKKFEEDMKFVMPAPEPASKVWTPRNAGGDGRIVDVHRALVLGLRDYVRKCGFQNVVVGLSGGIDSSLVAAIAVEALGRDAVTGISMPSHYSSKGSVADALALATNLGIEFELTPIEKIYDAFRELEAKAPASPPSLVDENIQARIRGTILMAHSNRTGALVLSTGNKSELAVGYCTLYGDMAGGLNILADVPKMMVYELARHINAKTPVIPEAVFTKAPSAELRPNQTDQDSLPPYEVLDAILSAYIEQHLSESDIIKKGFDAAVVKDIIRRITGNEYKRRQAAPGLKITSKAFGMGRRLPIARKW